MPQTLCFLSKPIFFNLCYSLGVTPSEAEAAFDAYDMWKNVVNKLLSDSFSLFSNQAAHQNVFTLLCGLAWKSKRTDSDGNSQADFIRYIQEFFDMYMPKQTCSDRLSNEKFGFVVQDLSSYLIEYQKQLACIPAFKELQTALEKGGILRVINVDGSNVATRSDAVGNVETTPSGRNNEQSNRKSFVIQAGVDLCRNAVVYFNFISNHAQESEYSSIEENTLIVADRGNDSKELYERINKSNACFLIRAKSNHVYKVTQAFSFNGTPIETSNAVKLKQLTKELDEADFIVKYRDDVEDIPLSELEKLPRLPKGYLRAVFQRNDPTGDKQGMLVFTNLGRSLFTAEFCIHLYLCRWIVELLFKNFKTCCSTKSSKSPTPETTEVMTLFSLSCYLILSYFGLKYEEHCIDIGQERLSDLAGQTGTVKLLPTLSMNKYLKAADLTDLVKETINKIKGTGSENDIAIEIIKLIKKARSCLREPTEKVTNPEKVKAIQLHIAKALDSQSRLDLIMSNGSGHQDVVSLSGIANEAEQTSLKTNTCASCSESTLQEVKLDRDEHVNYAHETDSNENSIDNHLPDIEQYDASSNELHLSEDSLNLLHSRDVLHVNLECLHIDEPKHGLLDRYFERCASRILGYYKPRRRISGTKIDRTLRTHIRLPKSELKMDDPGG